MNIHGSFFFANLEIFSRMCTHNNLYFHNLTQCLARIDGQYMFIGALQMGSWGSLALSR